MLLFQLTGHLIMLGALQFALLQHHCQLLADFLEAVAGRLGAFAFGRKLLLELARREYGPAHEATGRAIRP